MKAGVLNEDLELIPAVIILLVLPAVFKTELKLNLGLYLTAFVLETKVKAELDLNLRQDLRLSSLAFAVLKIASSSLALDMT